MGLVDKENDGRREWQREFEWDKDVQDANKLIFENEEFRENQREIINCTKSGRDVLALIPTGGGKSLTFQLSAVTDPGVTFVVMPLLSLIEDNLNFVTNLGIPACTLSTVSNSKNEKARISEYYRMIEQVEFKIVYLTPERINNSPGLLQIISALHSKGLVSRFVIDEVHCVSHWGQDFRKDYLELKVLRSKYPGVPILGLTATATVRVKEDICKQLNLQDVVCFQSSFNRTNLIYEIRDKKQIKNVDSDIAQLLNTRFRGKCGIIYCVRRKECEQLSETLKRNFKIKCDFYHADMAYD